MGSSAAGHLARAAPAALVTAAALAAAGSDTGFAGQGVAFLLAVWGITLVSRASYGRALASPLNRLRRYPALYWLVALVYLAGGVLLWLGAYNPPIGPVTPYGLFVLALLGWGAFMLLTFGFDAAQRREMAARLKASRLTGALISLSAVCLIVVAIEIGMRAFMAQSDGFARTLPHQRWVQLYWRPVNALGYRDYEIDPDETGQQILVLGDSFPSGHGIERIEETFPHVLGRMLGAGYRVHVAARPGWNTFDETRALDEYPLIPDVVILSYFINDIETAATQHGQYPAWPAAIESPALRWIIDHYYLANFLYWHVYVFLIDDFGDRYSDYIVSAYSDPAIWATQKAELSRLVEWTRARSARLIALIWPMLTDVEGSSPVTRPVETFFREQGIPVINMADDLIGSAPPSLVVNRFDSHPNAAVHALAAEKLYAVLKEGGG